MNADRRATSVDDRLCRCVVTKRLRVTADRCSVVGEMKAPAATAADASGRVTSKHTSLSALAVYTLRWHQQTLRPPVQRHPICPCPRLSTTHPRPRRCSDRLVRGRPSWTNRRRVTYWGPAETREIERCRPVRFHNIELSAPMYCAVAYPIFRRTRTSYSSMATSWPSCLKWFAALQPAFTKHFQQ